MYNMYMYTQTEVRNSIAEKIREIMCYIEPDYVEFSYDKIDTSINFEKLKRLSSLTSELLKDRNSKTRLYHLASLQTNDEDDGKAKVGLFLMIRNVIIHNPQFDTYDDIFVTKDSIKQENGRVGEIEKFFTTYKGKVLKYKIYLKEFGSYELKKSLSIVIPDIEKNEKIYLKDFISLSEAIWTFYVIDYYLADMGYEINLFTNASI